MLPVQITIRDVPNSEALENHIREKLQKLTHFSQKINDCQVVVEMPQKHKRKGKLFSVRIDVSVPGKELVVNKKENEDVYIALREAFSAMERQVEKYAQRVRGDIKSHEHIVHGHVARIFSKEGYGFIQSVDGNEYYFNGTSLINGDFLKLCVGDHVKFFEIPTSEGLKAHHVVWEKVS